MNTQNRLSVTLSPRMRKALELCADLDGSNPASYAGTLLTTAIAQDIEKSPVLRERWLEMEREALLTRNWSPYHSAQQEQALKQDAAIPGWFLAGDHPELYEYGVEKQTDGRNSGYLRSKEGWSEGFGTLMQTFKAGEYCNQRLRYSALVKAEDVEEWAGLWMRVDGPGGRMLAFDNMQNRSLKGTTDWQRYEVVLDVPQESTDIAFGILLDGPGQTWISDIQFAIVGLDIPITTLESLSDQPTNLNFTA
jgi:hypothetical protein